VICKGICFGSCIGFVFRIPLWESERAVVWGSAGCQVKPQQQLMSFLRDFLGTLITLPCVVLIF